MYMYIGHIDRSVITIYVGPCMQIKDLKMVISAVTDLERIQITPEDLLVSHTTFYIIFPLLLTTPSPPHGSSLSSSGIAM